jgi:hypothetical protein
MLRQAIPGTFIDLDDVHLVQDILLIHGIPEAERVYSVKRVLDLKAGGGVKGRAQFTNGTHVAFREGDATVFLSAQRLPAGQSPPGDWAIGMVDFGGDPHYVTRLGRIYNFAATSPSPSSSMPPIRRGYQLATFQWPYLLSIKVLGEGTRNVSLKFFMTDATEGHTPLRFSLSLTGAPLRSIRTYILSHDVLLFTARWAIQPQRMVAQLYKLGALLYDFGPHVSYISVVAGPQIIVLEEDGQRQQQVKTYIFGSLPSPFVDKILPGITTRLLASSRLVQ